MATFNPFKITAELYFYTDCTKVDVDMLFECDPHRNVECTKSNCVINGGECTRTKEIKYAKRRGVLE